MFKYNNLSKEELLQLVEKQEAELKTKKYGLVWDSEKEPEQVVLDCENNIPILQRVKEKEIKTDDSDDNILIEGDNYHALTCLNYTHKEKIDVIYIDPPYNTGNKSWKYNNNYVEKDDGYKHSKWLNMMEKRLRISKELLSDTGIIFVAIDDYEIHTVRCLLDDIFNEDNRLGNIVVVHNPGGRDDDRFVATAHEYMLIYSKNIDEANLKLMMLTDDQIQEYKLEDEISKYKLQSFTRTGSNSRPEERPKLYYSLYYNPITNKLSLEKESDDYCEILPVDGNGDSRVWRWGKETFDKNKNTEFIVSKFKEKYIVKVKKRLNFSKDEGSKAKSFWFNSKYNASTYGTLLLEEILNKSKAFSYPKSLFTVKDALYLSTKENSIVLDFFAGSGTTGHAVLELNKEDGGNRKFILCTNNEVGAKDESKFKEKYNITETELNEWQKLRKKEWLDYADLYGICSSVTYPRIHNIIKGYKFKGKDKTTLFEQKITFSQLKNLDSIVEEMDKTIEENKTKFDEIEKKFEDNTIKITGIKNIDGFKDGLNGNLQYFKTDLIPVERIDNISDHQRHELTEKAGQMIAIKENTFEEVETTEWYQIFENKDKSRKTAIYFRENMDEFENLVKKIGKTKTVLYVFSYSRIDKKIFNYLGKNIVLEDIPEPILEIYKEINLTLKDK